MASSKTMIMFKFSPLSVNNDYGYIADFVMKTTLYINLNVSNRTRPFSTLISD